jgi:DNA-binding NarL/FixJ family response regulator
MLRIVLVENQPTVRHGLHLMLAGEPGLSVIGEASDGESALELATTLCPDVVLIDVDMPRKDGIAAACALRLLCPQASIIILSLQDDALTRLLAEEAGAAAFVAKWMPPDTLLTKIRQVAETRLAQGKGGYDTIPA